MTTISALTALRLRSVLSRRVASLYAATTIQTFRCFSITFLVDRATFCCSGSHRPPLQQESLRNQHVHADDAHAAVRYRARVATRPAVDTDRYLRQSVGGC